MTTEQLKEATIEAQLFVESMSGREAGIYTLRKAFETGYLAALAKFNKLHGEDDGV